MNLTGWLDRDPTTDQAEQMAERAFVLGAVIYGLLGVVWGSLYLVMGLVAAALIPYAYVVFAAIVMVFFRMTHKFAAARTAILLAWVVLPLLLQLVLGGFNTGSAAVLWAVAAPIGSLFMCPREFGWWTGGFLAALVVALLAEPSLQPVTGLTAEQTRVFFALNLAGVGMAVVFIARDFLRRLRTAQDELEQEKAKSDALLLNVLPEAIAGRMKAGEQRIADRLEEVTIVFADLVGFTPMTEQRSADEIVTFLDGLVAEFDRLVEEHGMEKIRTVGDEYMAVAGAPDQHDDHLQRAAELALDMLEAAERHTDPSGHDIALRIGIDSGPVVAGVIGLQKFVYDVWGDSVNTASRMESHGVPGRIQVTERVYEGLRDSYRFEERGLIDVKGKGQMPTFFLLKPLSAGERVEHSA